MEDWIKESATCLIEQYRDIVKHHDGKLEAHITTRGPVVHISILAGKRFDFEIPKIKIQLNK